MTLVKKISYFFSLFGSIIFIDRFSKSIAEKTLKSHNTINYFNGFFKLIYAENKGAWGSLGSNWPSPYRDIVLIYIPVLVLLSLVVFVFFSKKINLLEVISYSLIAAGGISNLIDRINYKYVIDFLYIGWRSIGTNIFNIADMAIMLGFFLLLYNQFKNSKLEKEKK